MTTKEKKIKEIIDTHLKRWVDIGLNQLPGKVEDEMAEPSQDKGEEWRIWYPIDSRVTKQEVEEFENQIGHELPEDYKVFLTYKHFYELQIFEASFCSHPVKIWREKQMKKIFDYFPTEFLIDKGYLPFADWSDWGLLCFDTNRNKLDNNYPIVLWDHDIALEIEDRYTDFYELLVKLDQDERLSTG